MLQGQSVPGWRFERAQPVVRFAEPAQLSVGLVLVSVVPVSPGLVLRE